MSSWATQDLRCCCGTAGKMFWSIVVLAIVKSSGLELEAPSQSQVGVAFQVYISSQRPLQLQLDFVEVIARGPSIYRCGSFVQSDAKLQATCLIEDPGTYLIAAQHLYDKGRGVAMKAHIYRQRISESSADREIVVLSSKSELIFPDRKCESGNARGRWMRRSIACRVSHPLCLVPATEGWQWVPFECYFEYFSPELMRSRFQGKKFLFAGDSTMRFIWGQFMNLFQTKGPFEQIGFGKMQNPHLTGTNRPGHFEKSDRLRILTFAVDGVDCTYFGKLELHDRRWMEIMDQYLNKSTARIDLAILQSPNLPALCNFENLTHSIHWDYVIHYLVGRLLQQDPTMHLLRRTATSWSANSVPQGHCVSKQIIPPLESLIQKFDPKTIANLREEDAPRLDHFFQQPIDFWSITNVLYSGKGALPSASVHVSESGNVVLAHILATHISHLLQRAELSESRENSIRVF